MQVDKSDKWYNLLVANFVNVVVSLAYQEDLQLLADLPDSDDETFEPKEDDFESEPIKKNEV